jgi:hypothetical protein
VERLQGHRIDWIAGKNGEECSAPVTGIFKRILDQAKKRRGRAVQIAFNVYKEPWTQSGFRASFFKLVRKLTEAGHLQPGCTFHGLRHTIAAGAREGGESNARVAAAIGDKSAAMADIYARDADRNQAQMAILGAHQKRFTNIERKTEGKRVGNRPEMNMPKRRNSVNEKKVVPGGGFEPPTRGFSSGAFRQRIQSGRPR